LKEGREVAFTTWPGRLLLLLLLLLKEKI